MRLLGIDEAGRGCVFGDLVVAAYMWESEDQNALAEAGAGDSKAMSAKKRNEARERLTDLGRWQVRRITPAQIDQGNLNTLEEHAIADLVRAFEPTHVIIDALGHPTTLPKVQRRLAAAVAPLDPSWTIVPKADRDFPVCGAASIFAKTTRDAALAEHALQWGELGSGYPSDPKVKAWLRAHLETGRPWPAFVRTRWGTVQALQQGGLPV